MDVTTDLENESSLAISLLSKMPKPLRVLVVEDDKSQWPLWEATVQNLHPTAEIDWVTTENGAEILLRDALETGRPYGLVVSDIFLEDRETGIDLWNRYGEAAKNFIFVSSLSMRKFDSLMGSMMTTRHGAPLYLQKPLSPAVCYEAIKVLSPMAQGGPQ